MRLQRWKFLLVVTSVLIVSNGCQTHKHETKPEAAKATPVDSQTYIDRYNAAKLANSCDEFTALSKEREFSLNELAKLRAQEACLKVPIDYNSYTSWLKPSALDAAIASAQKRNDMAALVPLAIEKSKEPLNQEDRLQWAELAKTTAAQLKNDDLAAQADQRMFTISPRMKPDPAEKDFLPVANDFRYHREFEKARVYYEKVITGTAANMHERIAAMKGLRISYKNSRDNKMFLATNERLIAFLEKRLKHQRRNPQLFRQLDDAMIVEARSMWTQGHIKDAVKAIARFEKELRGRWSLMEIYWLRARMAEERNDLAASENFLNMALSQPGTDPETTDKMNWTMAWNERREKNFVAAEALLQKLMDDTLNESTHYRAEFWLGKVKAEMGHMDEAKAVWEKLTDDDPLGYYGLLAYYQLQKPILQSKSSPTAQMSTDVQEKIEQLLHPEIADALIQVQELDVLQSYLDEIAKNYKKSKNQDDDVWVKLLKYYAKAGLYIKLYENLNLISSDQRNVILQSNPELLFPRPFEDEVKEAAKQSHVEPELIYSIIRQESAFNPKARSGADAFGLMQLLPEIASRLSKKYDIPFEQNEDLYDPATNVLFGAMLLKDQLKRYHDQFILAVASYNANDQAIQNWMSSRFHGDALEFIEDIPYEETRGYVRLVMRNLIFYRLLASKNPMMTFPQWVLQLSSTGP